jgi:hypothetical protein
MEGSQHQHQEQLRSVGSQEQLLEEEEDKQHQRQWLGSQELLGEGSLRWPQ